METEKKNRIEQISNDFYDDHFIQELEMRLETDPLFPGGLIELIDENSYCGQNTCQTNACDDLECTINYCKDQACGNNNCTTNLPYPPCREVAVNESGIPIY